MRGLLVLAVSGTALAAPQDPVAPKLVGAAMTGQAYATVQSLVDHVGARLAGTPGADRAVAWAEAAMRAAGLKNVRREPVKVPRWIRGVETAELVAPAPLPLKVTALGGSVATPPDGITAEVVEVASFEELRALGGRVKGKLVLFNKRMPRTRDFEGYGAVVGLRAVGAIEAARLGAVGALIRSVGTGAHRLPHTGATHYDPKVQKIPYGALAAEDADHVHRLLAGGETVRLKLRLQPKAQGEVPSANVVGEVPGQTDEIVVIGAHLDSWDLGPGALDDGAGCAMVLETARLLNVLGLKPRRTVRVVLFMNEEHGLSGARAYAATHKDELKKHVAALEADSGAGRPLGWTIAGDAGVEKLRALAPAWLHGEVRASPETGADLLPLQRAGIPVLAVLQDMSDYFDWHHTAGDTLDKIDPIDLNLATAALASLTWAIADSTETLPPSPAPRF